MTKYVEISYTEYVIGKPDFFSGHFHVVDGPAGQEYWISNGRYHRTDGPAIIEYGVMSWFVNDIFYSSNKRFQKAAKLTDEEMLIMVLKYGNVT